MEYQKSVEAYIRKSGKWKEALLTLRGIILSTGMEETVKWGAPVYTVADKNVAGLRAFKSYVGVWFFQGALLKDKSKKLMSAQEGTQALRQWRFTSLEEIEKEKKTLKDYLLEAIADEKAGHRIKLRNGKRLVIPAELQAAFTADPGLKKSFESLSLTKKREYSEYISEAKKPETKQKRLEKIIPMILQRIGLNDRYKKK